MSGPVGPQDVSAVPRGQQVREGLQLPRLVGSILLETHELCRRSDADIDRHTGRQPDVRLGG